MENMQVTISVIAGIIIPVLVFISGWLMNRNRDTSQRQRQTEDEIHRLQMGLLENKKSFEHISGMISGLKEVLSKLDKRMEDMSNRVSDMERAYWSIPEFDRRKKSRDE